MTGATWLAVDALAARLPALGPICDQTLDCVDRVIDAPWHLRALTEAPAWPRETQPDTGGSLLRFVAGARLHQRRAQHHRRDA